MEPSPWDAIATIRRRPGKGLGGKDLWALHDLAYKVVDNAVNLAQRQLCSHLWVILLPERAIEICVNGPGLPIALHEPTGRPIAELIFTRAAGRYDGVRNQFIITYLGGGLTVVNALTADLHVEIRRDGYVWEQHFKAGARTDDLTRTRALDPQEGTGTTLTFTPDFSIFDSNDFQVAMLEQRLRDLAFLVPGLTIILRDERMQPQSSALEFTFYAEHGLVSYVDYLRGDALPVNRPVHEQHDVEVTQRYENPRVKHVEWVWQFATLSAHQDVSFATRFRLIKGCRHMYGLRNALHEFINRFALKTGALVPGDVKLSHDEICRALIVVIHFVDLYPIPYIGGSTLDYPELRDIMYGLMQQSLTTFAEQHPAEMTCIVDWLISRRFAGKLA